MLASGIFGGSNARHQSYSSTWANSGIFPFSIFRRWQSNHGIDQLQTTPSAIAVSISNFADKDGKYYNVCVICKHILSWL
jgi:hypothetical protein